MLTRLEFEHDWLLELEGGHVVPVMPARLGALYEGHSIMTVEGFIAQARWAMGRSGASASS